VISLQFLRTHAIALIVAIFFATPALAQLSPMGAKAATPDEEKTTMPVPLENIEADRTWAQQRLEEASAGLAEARAAVSRLDEGAPIGIESSLNELVTVQGYRALGLQQHLDLLAEVEVTREDLKQLRADEMTEVGPEATGSRGITAALAIWQELDEHKQREEADKLRIDTYKRGREQADILLDQTAQDYRRALETLEAAKDDEAIKLARAEVELQRVAREFARERVYYFATREQAHVDISARNEIQRRNTAWRLDRAVEGLTLPEAELKTREAAIQAEIEEIEATLVALASEEKVLQSQLQRAKAASTLSVEGTVPHADSALDMHLILDRAANLRATIDDLITIHLVWLNLELTWWQRRHQYDATPSADLLRQSSYSIDTSLSQAADLIRLVDLTREDVERRLANATAPGPEHDAYRQELNRRAERLARGGELARRVVAFLSLWKAELATASESLDLSARTGAWFAARGSDIEHLWRFELFAVEDRIMVDGEVIVEERPVTVGKVVLALLVLAAGLFVARWVGRGAGFLLAPIYRRQWGNRLFIERVIHAGAVVAVVVLALITVKIPLTVFAFLGGALAIGVGFGAQNLINNFISGFILLAERPIRTGDIIEVEGIRGKVEAIGERCTRVRRFDGIEILIPNSQLLEQSVTNMTHSDQRVRSRIAVGVAYGSPTRKVEELLAEVALEHPLVIADPPPLALFEELGESAMNFALYFWVDLPAQPDARVVTSDLLHRIYERTAEEGISIAFPQRDIHFDASGPIQVEVLGSSTPSTITPTR
jgi:small-conductance mechanosensitive channel